MKLTNGISVASFGLPDLYFEDGVVLEGKYPDAPVNPSVRRETEYINRKIPVTLISIKLSFPKGGLSTLINLAKNYDLVLTTDDVIAAICLLDHGLIRQVLIDKCRVPVFKEDDKVSIKEFYYVSPKQKEKSEH